MTVYSFRGRIPGPMPFRIRLPDGTTMTDPSTFTDQDLATAGYTAVNDKPTVADTQIVIWDYENIDWLVRDKTAEELANDQEVKNNFFSLRITEERDRRIELGFYFNGHVFDSRPEDQKRISGAALLAFMAVAAGNGTAGDYYWHMPGVTIDSTITEFSWITHENVIIPMDAPTVIEFGKIAAEWERNHVFAARTLKDMDPVPEDYKDDIYWPARAETYL